MALEPWSHDYGFMLARFPLTLELLKLRYELIELQLH
jgi:hypothetical protein